jgi:hypothetical protein
VRSWPHTSHAQPRRKLRKTATVKVPRTPKALLDMDADVEGFAPSLPAIEIHNRTTDRQMSGSGSGSGKNNVDTVQALTPLARGGAAGRAEVKRVTPVLVTSSDAASTLRGKQDGWVDSHARWYLCSSGLGVRKYCAEILMLGVSGPVCRQTPPPSSSNGGASLLAVQMTPLSCWPRNAGEPSELMGALVYMHSAGALTGNGRQPEGLTRLLRWGQQWVGHTRHTGGGRGCQVSRRQTLVTQAEWERERDGQAGKGSKTGGGSPLARPFGGG